MFFKTFRLGYGRVLAPIDPSIATTLKHQRGGDGDRGQYICGIKKGACLCGVVRPTVSAKALSFRFDSGVSRMRSLTSICCNRSHPPGSCTACCAPGCIHTTDTEHVCGRKAAERNHTHTSYTDADGESEGEGGVREFRVGLQQVGNQKRVATNNQRRECVWATDNRPK